MKCDPIRNANLMILALSLGTYCAEIKAIGYGEVFAWPNYVEITVETKVLKPRLRDALEESHSIEQNAIGITRKYTSNSDSLIYDIRTITDKEVDWNSSSKKEVFLGYSGAQRFSAKISDLEKVTPFIDEILKLPATKIANIRFRHTKEDSLQSAAEIVAVQNAITKGKLIAKSYGSDNVKVKEISDYLELKNPERWELQQQQGMEIDVYSKGIGMRNISFSPSTLIFTSRSHVVLNAE